MSAHTPWPWQVGKSNYPQPGGRNFFVFRALLVDASNSHYDQIRDSNGALLRFESEEDARAAIAKATGAQA